MMQDYMGTGDLPAPLSTADVYRIQSQVISNLKGKLSQATEDFKAIKKHVEISSPTGYILSATWTIAEGAIQQIESEATDE